MTDMTRRSFTRLLAGTGAFAAMSQMGRYSANAAKATDFRATVGIFLYGGNDSWNMVVPVDDRYSGYAAARGTKLAIPKASLVPLTGSAFGIHPAMAALKPIWDAGAMSAVLNTGTLYVPLDKAAVASRPDLCPTSLMSHSDEQQHWQGLRARDTAVDGFLGRLNDRIKHGSFAPVMTFATPDLIMQSRVSQPLILTTSAALTRNGANTGSPDNYPGAREVAMSVFAKATDSGRIFEQTTTEVGDAYALADPLRGIVNALASPTDAFFVDPVTGLALSSSIAKQLSRVARMIAQRDQLQHGRQAFFASHGGFDTHSVQADSTVIGGVHASLLKDLSLALAAFYKAMASLGLDRNVTAFTMSDFGRTLRANGSIGTDHGWGGNHLVVGGALKPQTVHGRYPDTTLGGADDLDGAGRFIPSISQEEYIGAIMRWHGVSDGDMDYVLPNWETWNTSGRGPVPFFT